MIQASLLDLLLNNRWDRGLLELNLSIRDTFISTAHANSISARGRWLRCAEWSGAALTLRKFAHLISGSAQTDPLSSACLRCRVSPLVSASATCSFVSRLGAPLELALHASPFSFFRLNFNYLSLE